VNARTNPVDAFSGRPRKGLLLRTDEDKSSSGYQREQTYQ